MAFEFKQAELQRPVQRQPQLFETLEASALWGAQRRLLEPQDFIAANLGSGLTPLSTAHRSLAEIALSPRYLAVSAQCRRQFRPEKIIDDHPALRGETVGDPIEVFQLGQAGQCGATSKRARP